MLRRDLSAEIELWMGQSPLMIPPEEVVKLVAEARKEFLADFVAGGGAFLSKEGEKEIQDWVKSEAAQQVEQEMAVDLDWVFEIMKKEELGGHDLRHMLLVSWTGVLTLAEMDWMENWRKWSMISCLSHDWGRVIEGKMRQAIFARGETEFFWPDSIHATLSFFVLEKFLESYRGQMPKRLLDLVLYAVLEHPGRPGAYESAGELSALVQHSDRTQMINMESTPRLLSEEVSQFGYYLGVEKSDKAKFEYVISDEGFRQSAKQREEFFWRRIHLLIGKNVLATESEWKKKNGRLLWTMCTDWQREQIFAPEIMVYDEKKMSLEDYKKRVTADDWKEIGEEEVWREMKGDLPEEKWVEIEEWARKDIKGLLDAVLNGKGMSSSKAEIEAVVEAWKDLTDEEERWRFKLTLGLVMEYRREQDEVRGKELTELQEKFGKAGIIGEALNLVQKYL